MLSGVFNSALHTFTKHFFLCSRQEATAGTPVQTRISKNFCLASVRYPDSLTSSDRRQEKKQNKTEALFFSFFPHASILSIDFSAFFFFFFTGSQARQNQRMWGSERGGRTIEKKKKKKDGEPEPPRRTCLNTSAFCSHLSARCLK